jgi:DHA1 family tetracycline resistance protein-like MFS transporter
MNTNKKAGLGFVFVTLLIDVIGIGIIIPVIPDLIKELTGEGLSEAAQYNGWLTFAYAIMQFLFSPVLGALSDRYGRRPILLIALLGLGFDYIFSAFAPTIGWLFVGRILAGISGASFTTATAYIADISTPEKRAQNFGLVGVAFGVGFIIGPVIGGIAGNWGPRVPFMVAAAFTLLNFLFGYLFVPESLPKEDRRAFEWKRANPIGSLFHLKKYPVVAGLIWSMTLFFLASHAVQSNWAFFTEYKFDWNNEIVGYSLGFVGVLVAVVQGGLIRLIIPKIGQKWALYIGLVLEAAALLLFAFANQGWMMFAILIPYALGGIAGPSIQSITSAQVPATEQGELQGALTSLMSVTTILGPLLMNNLFSYFTGADAPIELPGAPFLAGAIMIAVSVYLCVRTLRKYEG